MEGASQQWRKSILEAVKSISTDTVIVTDYLVINVIVGAALESDRTVVCAPEFGSVTELLMGDGVLQMLSRGEPIVGTRA